MNPTRPLRPLDYLYSLRSEEAYGWWTGTLKDGRQVLISGVVIFFDCAGNLLAVDDANLRHWRPAAVPYWRDQMGFEEGPIHVKRFHLPEHQMGIDDITDAMSEFLDEPSDNSWSDEERQEYPEMIREWVRDGQYVFNSGAGDYYMSHDGVVETS